METRLEPGWTPGRFRDGNWGGSLIHSMARPIVDRASAPGASRDPISNLVSNLVLPQSQPSFQPSFILVSGLSNLVLGWGRSHWDDTRLGTKLGFWGAVGWN